MGEEESEIKQRAFEIRVQARAGGPLCAAHKGLKNGGGRFQCARV